MTYVQMVAKAICEAKGLPDAFAQPLVSTMVQGVALAGLDVFPLLQEVPPKVAREYLRACRRDKAKFLAWLAECERDTAAIYAARGKMKP